MTLQRNCGYAGTDMPGPGRRLGHDVTMRQRRVSPRAMRGAAIAPASPNAPVRASVRRVIIRSSCSSFSPLDTFHQLAWKWCTGPCPDPISILFAAASAAVT